VVVCPGCGARNEPDARACDWCGRPFVDEQRQITVPWLIPATAGAIALLAVATIVAALLGARTAAPRGVEVAPSTAAAPTLTQELGPIEIEIAATQPDPETAPQEFVRIANTGGVGAFIRREPRANAPGLIALRDGVVVRVIGPDTRVAGRIWRNVEDQRGNRGWTPAEYLAPSDSGF
jgi:hypothetical protein